MNPAALLGVWRLTGFELRFSDEPGRRVLPFGPAPQGRLHYSPGGHVCAVLADPRVGPLGLHAPGAVGAADEAARARAFAGSLAYAGRWRVEGEEVVHEVELSTLPDLVGQLLRRHVLLQDELVSLETREPRQGGGLRIGRLTWRRLEGA